MSNKPIPEACYPCAGCGDIQSFPADHLYWSETMQTWYCDECWLDPGEHWNRDAVIDFGISLADELKQRETEKC